MKCVHSLLVIACAVALPRNAYAVEQDTLVTGTAHNSVVKLTQQNFLEALEDPANPFWLLKFYAPWCAFCKKLAPVLDETAPDAAGIMAIGKIDCTEFSEKLLCEQHNIRSFPTLKMSLDGTIVDYPGGRSKEEILQFAKKMNRPMVSSVSTMHEAVEYAGENSSSGVAFVVFDAAVSGTTMEEKLQSTTLTQVVAQVARKYQAYAEFLLLEAPATTQEAPFFCRVEEHVESRCYKGDMSTMDVLDFCKMENVPTVSHLGPSNFFPIGRKGRPLVIGVVDGQNKDQVATTKQALAKFAVSGPVGQRDKYYYGYFDGTIWKKFLEQFLIDPTDSPLVFLLDVPSKTYWKNITYAMDVEGFLAAVEMGSVKKQIAGRKGGINGFMNLLAEYHPWSGLVCILMGVIFATIVFMIVSTGDVEEERKRADKKEK